MIERLDYAAALVYSPRGISDVSKKSRRCRDALKGAHPRFLAQAATLVARHAAEGRFLGFFGPGVTLVQVPGSAPRRDKSSLWVAERLRLALRSAGIAGQVWAPLRRVTAVAKSAYAARGERPSVQEHIQSLCVDDRFSPTEHIVLVDDVVTKGRTPLAAASVIMAAIPGVDVKAFALIRTMGLVPEIDVIVDPVVGHISWNGDAERQP